jgi:hypothetical protein
VDVDWLLQRGPQLCLVDELAHSNHSGGRNPKRWQDVEELLEAGHRLGQSIIAKVLRETDGVDILIVADARARLEDATMAPPSDESEPL